MEMLLILKLLGVLAALGVGSAVGKALLSRLPKIDLHSKYDLLNKIVDALGNGAEDVVKSVLTSDDIDAILTAVSGGVPLPTAIASLMPVLEAQLQAAVGPTAQSELAKLLGDEGAATRVSQTILSSVHDVWTAHKAMVDAPKPGTVVALASGHLLVVPAGQKLPEGSKSVAA